MSELPTEVKATPPRCDRHGERVIFLPPDQPREGDPSPDELDRMSEEELIALLADDEIDHALEASTMQVFRERAKENVWPTK